MHTYNLTNTGPVPSWTDIARQVFGLCGRHQGDVTPITTEQYAAGRTVAPRPVNSSLNLQPLKTGFTPAAASDRLAAFVTRLLAG